MLMLEATLGQHPILNALFLNSEQGFENTRRDMGNERESRYVLSIVMTFFLMKEAGH